jgi:uncharacterized SAM-binding protein YcdF (DUF218 family)
MVTGAQPRVRRTTLDPRRTRGAERAPEVVARDRVIVVLGYHEVEEDGSHGISAICRAGVRRAAELAADPRTQAVIFTGWSFDGGPSEAEQMAALWTGRRDIGLIEEPLATNTAENAVRSLDLVRGLPGTAEVMVVCSIRHLPRVRFLFDRLFRGYGYHVGYRCVARPSPSPRLIQAELSSISRMAGDRRRALRLLQDADSSRRRAIDEDETDASA